MNLFERLRNSFGGRQETPRQNRTAPAREPSGIERRRLPRVKVLSALEAYGVEVATKVVVREISLGGFSAESPVIFQLGSHHTFLFSTGEGLETMVRCECRHVTTAEGPGCVAGFQFLPNQDESLKILVDLYRTLRRRFAE